MITDDQYNVLLKSVQGCRDDVGRVDRDLGEDRKDIQDVILRVGTVEQRLDTIFNLITTLQNKVGDSVEQAMQPLVDKTDELTVELKNKKTLIVKNKRRWYTLW